MNTQFWWIFDALVAIIAVIVIYSNAKRGITKVLVVGIGYIIATIAASLVCVPAASAVYASVAAGSDLAALERVGKQVSISDIYGDIIDGENLGFNADRNVIKAYMQNSTPDVYTQDIYRYMNRRNGDVVMELDEFQGMLRTQLTERYGAALSEEVPEYVRMNFEKKMTADPEAYTELMSRLSSGHAAEYVEETYAKEPTLQVLQIFCYLILFSILMVIAAVLSATLENKIFFNNTMRKERILGGMMGLLEALALLILMTMIVRLIVMLSGGDALCFNEPTIAKSKVFNYFYSYVNKMF